MCNCLFADDGGNYIFTLRYIMLLCTMRKFKWKYGFLLSGSVFMLPMDRWSPAGPAIGQGIFRLQWGAETTLLTNMVSVFLRTFPKILLTNILLLWFIRARFSCPTAVSCALQCGGAVRLLLRASVGRNYGDVCSHICHSVETLDSRRMPQQDGHQSAAR